MSDDDLGFVPDSPTTEHDDDLGFIPDEVPAPKTTLGQDLGDVAKGVGQGVTFGFGDEILGALEAAKDKVTGSDEALLDLYRKYQKMNEASWKESQERSPWLTGGGEALGSIVSPVTGALGLAKSGLGLGQIAARSGLAGSIAGYGNAEGGNTTADDIISGAKIGAIGGTLGGAIGKGLSKVGSKIGDLIEDSPIARQTVTSFKEGLGGKGFTGDANTRRLGKELEDATAMFKGDVEKARQYIANKYGEVLEPGGKPLMLDVTADQTNPLRQAIEILEKRNAATGGMDAANLARIQNLERGKISARDLKELHKYLRDEAPRLNQGETARPLYEAADRVNDILKNHPELPGYRGVNEQFKQFEELPESLVAKVPINQLDPETAMRLKTEGVPFYNKASDIIEKSNLPFQGGKKQMLALDEFERGLNEVGAKDPELLKSMGINSVEEIPAYINSIRKKADVQAIGTVTGKSGSFNKSIDPLEGASIKSLYLTSNLAGQATRKLGGAKTIDWGRQLYNYTNPKLETMAQKVKTIPGFENVGTALEQAIANKDTAAKNAALFIIIQNQAKTYPVLEESNGQQP